MTWKAPSGAITLVLVPTLAATLVLGCAPSEEVRTATAELGERITALEQQVGALEERVETLALADLGVNIKLKGTGEATELAWVHPDRKPVCKEASSGCPTEVMWRLLSDLEEGWSVVIREKKNSLDPGCFTPPSGQDHWTLTSRTTPVSSGPTSCEEGAVWEYDVILMKETAERDRIDPLFFLPFI
jgi:hypothetical protein